MSIPTPDMLGIPLPPWPVLLLLAVTLALHWMFIGATVGGTAVVLASVLRKGDSSSAEICRRVLVFLPFTLSMGVTLGIAPLLFVQILYGNFFYSANVLVAWPWLNIINLVILGTYLLYYGRRRLEQGKGLGPVLPGVVLAILVTLAATLASNMTLMQTPAAWAGLYDFHGLHFYWGGMVIPRAITAVLVFLAIGGLFVALLGRVGLLHLYGLSASDLGLKLALPAAILQPISALVLLGLLPENERAALLWTGLPAAWTYLAAAGLFAAPVLIWRAKRRPGRLPVILPILTYYAALVMVAFARDNLRQTALGPVFQLQAVKVNPQWGPFVMFLAFFLAAAGAIVLLLKLARTRK